MKLSKRIFSLILSVIMMLSVFTGTAVNVFAEESDTISIDIFNAYTAPNTRAASTNLDYIETKYSNVISEIVSGFNSFSSEVNLYGYNLDGVALNNILNYVVSYKMCYFVDEISYNIYSTGRISLIPTYIMSKSDVISGNILINQTMDKIAAGASAFSTDIEKIMYVHDYIVGNLAYDYDAYDRRDQTTNNVYYAVKTGLTMCVGYSETFCYALERIGIKSYIVTSNKNAHAWNLVYLDGRYYHVDCTFDDPSYTNENLTTNPLSGSYSYENLMCSSSLLVENYHIPSDWEVNGINIYNYASSDIYDDFFWRDIEEHIVYADGKWYVPFTKESKSYTTAGFTVSEVEFINNIKYNIKQVRDINSYYSTSLGNYSIYYPVLQTLDNVLYYRTSEGIFAYTPDSSEDTLIYAATMPEYNIYDFVINPEKRTFSVMYGKKPDDNGVLLEYKIADYFCADGHDYQWAAVNGVLVKKCAKCSKELKRLQFTDMNGLAAYGDYVEYTSEYNKFINGTNPPYYTTFSPATSITRAMFVTILYRMAGSPYDNGGNPYSSNPFSDVPENAYYYNPACWALENGITNQLAFKPYDNVSREQTASFLFRYAQANGLVTDNAYKKVNLSAYRDYYSIRDWSKEAMQWANYNGMITGTLQGYANPQGSTLRIHATKILYNFGKACNIGNFE